MRFIKNKNIIIPVLLFGAVFGVYLYTAPRYPTCYADSDELMAAAYTMGVPHAPGYPLFALLGKLFTFIPIGTIAFRFSIFSSFFSTLTVLLVYLVIRKLTENIPVALIGAFSLAFSYIFWLWSIVPENFFLLGFFTTLLLCLMVSWYESQKTQNAKRSKYPYLIIFVLALGSLSHQLIVFTIPALIYFAWVIDKKLFKPSKKWLGIIASGIAGLLPLVYLPLAATREPFIDYGNPTNFIRFWELITRHIYRMASPQGTAYLPVGGLMLAERFYQFLYYLVFLIDQFTPVVIVLAIIGIVAVMARKSTRKAGVFLFLFFVFTGPVLAFYAPLSIDYPYKTYLSSLLARYVSSTSIETTSSSYNALGALERFYIMNFITFSIFVGLGIFSILNLLKKFEFNKKLTIAVVCLFFLVPIFPLRDNFAVVNKRNFRLGQDYMDNLFLNIEPNAIFITRGDRPTFATYFYQQVEKKRLDVTHISFGWREWHMERLKKREPDLFITKTRALLAGLREIIQNNIDKRPIYTSGLPNKELVQLGIAGAPFVVTPRGMILKIDWNWDLGAEDYWKKMVWHGPKQMDAYYDQYAKELIEQYLIGRSNGYYHYRTRGYHDLAYQEMQAMIEIAPDQSLTRIVTRDWGERGRPVRAVRELVLGDAKTHFDLSISYFRDEKIPEAMAEMWAAVYLEPENSRYRFTLGGLYEMIFWYDEALEQYEKILEQESEGTELREKTETAEARVKAKIEKQLEYWQTPEYVKIYHTFIKPLKRYIDYFNFQKPWQLL